MIKLSDIISSDECIEVVRNSRVHDHTFRVVNYRLDKIEGEPGYIGEYAHLEVTVELENGQTLITKYFLKCLPFTDLKQRQYVLDLGMFTKEAVCYRELLSTFEQNPEKVIKWRPACWLARDDLMVMEDLVNSGYRSMPFQRPFGQTHMELVLERMAQMHACSLDLEYNRMNGVKLGDQFEGMLYETAYTRQNTWFVTGLKGILTAALEGSKYAKHPEYKAIIQAELLHRLDRIYELSEPLNRFQSQDQTGADNYDRPIDCVLIDFQLVRYQPPAIDFLCTIYMLTRRFQRNELYDYYAKYYHEQLGEKLRKLNLQIESILPWKQFLDSLDHYKLFGLLWSGVMHAYVNLPEGHLAELHVKDSEAYHEFVSVSRDAVLMKFLSTDRYYRDTLLDSVDETMEYLFGFK
ncbi:uncharacterized protein LOC135699396 [Ochlerotatus camptorhynchus]|uniref:uncharacterized protein LOC135699396 n=1 Tax=Ochlerotatus camptorhynchus TaxID=644619 RepID=UPI0031D1FF18